MAWLENRDVNQNFFFYKFWWKKYGWRVNNNESSCLEQNHYWDIQLISLLFSEVLLAFPLWAHRVQAAMQIDSVPIHFTSVFYLFVSHRAILLKPGICSFFLLVLFILCAAVEPSNVFYVTIRCRWIHGCFSRITMVRGY